MAFFIVSPSTASYYLIYLFPPWHGFQFFSFLKEGFCPARFNFHHILMLCRTWHKLLYNIFKIAVFRKARILSSAYNRNYFSWYRLDHNSSSFFFFFIPVSLNSMFHSVGKQQNFVCYRSQEIHWVPSCVSIQSRVLTDAETIQAGTLAKF